MAARNFVRSAYFSGTTSDMASATDLLTTSMILPSCFFIVIKAPSLTQSSLGANSALPPFTAFLIKKLLPTDVINRLNAALQGRYRIEGELGEGGMATVYLAEDLKHERKVALKVLKPELAVRIATDEWVSVV